MPGGNACLLDGNILLRISKSDDPQHAAISHVQALASFSEAGARYMAFRLEGETGPIACLPKV